MRSRERNWVIKNLEGLYYNYELEESNRQVINEIITILKAESLMLKRRSKWKNQKKA